MLLGDTEVSEEDKKAHREWLEQSPLHQAAWQRVQMVESELSKIKTTTVDTSVRTLNQVAHNRKRRTSKQIGAVLGLLLMLGIGVNSSYEDWRYDYATGTGEHEKITLEGGAIVHLDSQTQLDLERENGHLFLRLHQGQILVDSATAVSANKPRVITDDAYFTPVGTRFVVHKLDDGSGLAVTEGKVRITAGQLSDLAVAGEARYVGDLGITTVKSQALAADAWVENLIEANNAPLGDVLTALNRHHAGWLQYSPDVAQLRVTGVFRLDDIEGALDTLQHSLPIQVKKTTRLWIRVDKK